ncbi:conserved hypothetical protein [Trichinella spiralis]|uniref:hypothetical protein n=1 Tax=Trichinella spiralis TaxID=6334 RepID=UPI0001EFB7A6|nr:conserved hypothetical protein [Trichinella spiralis]
MTAKSRLLEETGDELMATNFVDVLLPESAASYKAANHTLARIAFCVRRGGGGAYDVSIFLLPQAGRFFLIIIHFSSNQPVILALFLMTFPSGVVITSSSSIAILLNGKVAESTSSTL